MKPLASLIGAFALIAIVIVARWSGATAIRSPQLADPTLAVEPAVAIESLALRMPKDSGPGAEKSPLTIRTLPQGRYAGAQVGDDVFTEMRIKTVISRDVETAKDPVRIDRLLAILSAAYEVNPGASLRARFTHTLMLREFWWYDAKTGEVGVLNGKVQPVYQIPLELRREFEGLLNEPNKAPEPTSTSVTPRAGARVAPAALVAHL